MSGGSSAVERDLAKVEAEGSIPSPRSKQVPRKRSEAKVVRSSSPETDEPTAGTMTTTRDKGVSQVPATTSKKHAGGRPRTIVDMKAYKAEKERVRRAKLKAEGKTK